MKQVFDFMKKLLLCLAFFLFFTPIAQAKEYYITDSFDVTLDISEDRIYSIKEDITVTYTQSRHGLIRIIPKHGVYFRYIHNVLDQKKYSALVQKPSVKEHLYSFGKTSNKNYFFQIGDKDVLVNGRQNYQISYDYLLYDDEITEFDDVYINLIPHAWASPIKKASITVTLPKAFDGKNIEVITGLLRGVDTKKASYTLENNTIKIHLNQALRVNEGLTLRVLLPEGYFSKRSFYLTLWEKFIVGTCFLFVIIAFILWFKFGRIRPFPVSVTFYPPRDMNPVQLIYAYNQNLNVKEISSLLLYFASKDLISLDVDDENDVKVRKKANLPSSSPEHEKIFFKSLFGSSYMRSLHEIPREYYALLEETLSHVKYAYKEEVASLYHKNSFIVSLIFFVMILLPYPLLIFGDFIEPEGFFIFSIITCFAPFITFILKKSSRRSTKKSRRRKRMFFASFFFIVLSCIPYFLSTTSYDSPLVAVVVILSTAIILYLTPSLPKPTKEGEKLLGEIQGFRNFIDIAQKDKLNALVEKNPHYFYDILPYAYVFGLSTKWLDKLELVQIPQDMTYSHYEDRHGHDRVDSESISNLGAITKSLSAVAAVEAMVQSTQRAIASERNANSSSSSGSSGGGGSGSSGSSGSSGGGAGGGGGGSW